MHVASRPSPALYPSLAEVCPDVPSRAYVETPAADGRPAARRGARSVRALFRSNIFSPNSARRTRPSAAASSPANWATCCARVRGNPNGRLADDEQLDPAQIAFLITRPAAAAEGDAAPRGGCVPAQLVLRDVHGRQHGLRPARRVHVRLLDTRAFDLDRLLHYSFFSSSGLTIHARGVPALVRFVSARAELFRSIYFHRTVRAIDLTLADLFADSRRYLFPGRSDSSIWPSIGALRNGRCWSTSRRWSDSADAEQRRLGDRWRSLLNRRDCAGEWPAERNGLLRSAPRRAGEHLQPARVFRASAARRLCRHPWPTMPLRFDLARHINRPGTQGPAAGQNFLFDEARGAGATDLATTSCSGNSVQLSHLPRLCRNARARCRAGRGARRAGRPRRR